MRCHGASDWPTDSRSRAATLRCGRGTPAPRCIAFAPAPAPAAADDADADADAESTLNMRWTSIDHCATNMEAPGPI
ncbi:hypothetical protein FOFC_11056 [Fusarium oxysporum]|nr:hypothetical protein FOFC_11056 [Fusarium oxysporum]